MDGMASGKPPGGNQLPSTLGTSLRDRRHHPCRPPDSPEGNNHNHDSGLFLVLAVNTALNNESSATPVPSLQWDLTFPQLLHYFKQHQPRASRRQVQLGHPARGTGILGLLDCLGREEPHADGRARYRRLSTLGG